MCLCTGYENVTVHEDLERQSTHNDDGEDNGM